MESMAGGPPVLSQRRRRQRRRWGLAADQSLRVYLRRRTDEEETSWRRYVVAQVPPLEPHVPVPISDVVSVATQLHQHRRAALRCRIDAAHVHWAGTRISTVDNDSVIDGALAVNVDAQRGSLGATEVSVLGSNWDRILLDTYAAQCRALCQARERATQPPTVHDDFVCHNSWPRCVRTLAALSMWEPLYPRIPELAPPSLSYSLYSSLQIVHRPLSAWTSDNFSDIDTTDVPDQDLAVL